MLRKYRNELLQLIAEAEIEPTEFSSYEKEVADFDAFIIKYDSSKLYFMVRTNDKNYWELDCRFVSFAPTYPLSDYYPEDAHDDPFSHRPNDQYSIRWTDFNEIKQIFRQWLNYDVAGYIEEKSIPDLWKQVEGKYLLNPDPLSEVNNSAFTLQEQKLVEESLERFKHLVIDEYSPSEEQLEIIVERLNYLASSMERLGKTDWQGVAISAVLSISVALSLDTA